MDYIKLYQYAKLWYGDFWTDYTDDEMTDNIATLFEFELNNIERLYALYSKQYSPLQNYDMTESGTDGRKESDETVTDEYTAHQSGLDSTDSVSANGMNQDGTIGTNLPTTTESVSPYNDGLKTVNETVSTGQSGIITNTNTSSDNTSTNTKTRTHTDHDFTFNGNTMQVNESTYHELSRSGNIGVTTSQQMYIAEWDLRTTKSYYQALLNMIFVPLIIQSPCV